MPCVRLEAGHLKDAYPCHEQPYSEQMNLDTSQQDTAHINRTTAGPQVRTMFATLVCSTHSNLLAAGVCGIAEQLCHTDVG